MIKIYIDEDFFLTKKLYRSDRRKLKKYPNLKHSKHFRFSRAMKYKYKLKDKICISHKDQICVIAKSKHKIGVDVEELKDRKFSSIMEFCFNDKEKELVLKSKDKITQFYKIYTFKEAYIKYKNLDFSYLKKVNFLNLNGMINYSFFLYKKYIICIVF